MLIVALSISLGTEGGADTWQTLANGRHHAHFGLDTNDPFSPNSLTAGPTQATIDSLPKKIRTWANRLDLSVIRKWHPTGWINQNWLTGLLFYAVYRGDNPAFSGLFFLKFLLYFLIATAAYFWGRSLGLRPGIATAASCIAMWLSRTMYTIRADEMTKIFTPLFLMILVLSWKKNCRFIWAIIPLAALWSNMHGAFVYMFMMLFPHMLVYGISLIRKHKTEVTVKGLFHILAATMFSLLTVVLFNPWRLSNITHPFHISLSREGTSRWHNIVEWHPAFSDWNNYADHALSFLIFLICATLIVLIRYAGCAIVKKFPNKAMPWPKISPSLLAIALLTVLMGLRYRRFIPLAVLASCPILGFVVQDTLWRIPRLWNLCARVLPWAAATLVLALGIWTGFRYNQVYRQPWPYTPQDQPFFNRMMETHLDPVSVADFLALNNVKGTVLNAWEQGSVLNWLQKPDDQTGKTPVQVFIDGRAQAAYNTIVYDQFNSYWIGGPHGVELYRKGKNPGPFDLYQMGLWLDRELKSNQVNLVLVPLQKYSSNLLPTLSTHPDWRAVYRDPRHTLLTDITTAQGQRLFDGMGNGDTVYPNAFLSYLNQAYYHYNHDKSIEGTKVGFELAQKAYLEFPSSQPMILLSHYSSRIPHLQGQSREFCEVTVRDFQDNYTEYSKKPGFHARLNAMSMAARLLAGTEKSGQYAVNGDKWKQLALDLEQRFIWK